MEPESADRLLKRYARRNFWLNILDGVAFVFAISMVSRYTVLPLFVSRLSSERWLQGLIPTLTQVGAVLPALFMAPLTASLARRKPLILTVTIGERLPFLLLGLLLLFWPGLPASSMLAIFFVLYAIYSFSGGFVSIAWQDFIARIIPERRWGTFFGLQFGLGGVLGVAGAGVASLILATQPFPQSVGMLALIGFGAMILSYIFLASTVEPPQKPAPRQPMLAFLSGIGPLLRRDHGFRRYLFSRAGVSLGLVGHSFVTAAALERFQLSDAEIGVFTTVLLAAQALSHIGSGALADRWGHKQVLELATAIGLLALLLAVVAPSAAWFFPIFALVGIAQAGYQLSGFTIIFAFSTPAERPTYIGVANAALAPIAAFGPLLAGLLAERAGYNTLFLTLMTIGLAGLIGLHWRVPTPARAARAAPSE
ncbi:MAG TPA: MFS transporter [Roseiflexaceae bacterium]|nr:MFS transporter [Roseiflexaceae bacterium]